MEELDHTTKPAPEARPPKPRRDSRPIGKRIKETFENNLLVVCCSIFAAGCGTMIFIYEQTKPWLIEKEVKDLNQQIRQLHSERSGLTNAQIPKLVAPIKITVIGPLNGAYRQMGLAQLRGIISGVMHFAVDRCGINSRDYKQIATITTCDDSKWLLSPNQMDTAYTSIPDGDIYFGPVFSSLAIRFLNTINIQERKTNAYFLFSTAATPKIRDSKEYASRVYQLSANIDSYVSQQTRYIANFHKPGIKRLIVFYRDDEYGDSANRAYLESAAKFGMDFKSMKLPITSDALTEDEALKKSLKIVCDAKDKWIDWKGGPEQAVAIVEFGDPLAQIANTVRTNFPGALLISPTSIEQELITSRKVDGMLLCYSYSPDDYSVNTAAFEEYTKRASVEVTDLTGADVTGYKPQTIDAEVHDAIIAFLDQQAERNGGKLLTKDGKYIDCSRRVTSPYVTRISLGGVGREFGNTGSLPLFMVKEGRLETVKEE